ncbi:GNAT family N-acetyltransferase [Kitasatospora sp. MAP5-34]|uniref:GNAT family N-acetyltransferase n=1 Tax=Kitasatospora sp. MAP5-34 TaxID=3035102 RepID=UPI00247342A6|nr:GNAT family N-acetyltransferase [Kitasatospora sp. MAP5-34]
MTTSAPRTWTITPTPVGHPDAVVLLRGYLDELISRYYGRPALESEIVQEMGDGSDLVAPHGVLLVARDAGVLVGCAGLRWLSPEVGELTRVFVTAQARRGGGGARVVAAAEEAARAHGVGRVLLNTRKDLTEAIALYRRLGYRETDPYGDDPYAELWFAKNL